MGGRVWSRFWLVGKGGEMNGEELSAAAGILLSLAFSYIPGLSERFAALDPAHKRLWMLAMLAAAALGALLLDCLGAPYGLGASCDRVGLWELCRAFCSAAVANQAAFALTPRRNGNGNGPAECIRYRGC
jgi:hypothetical protein